jgi:hypothetical protein
MTQFETCELEQVELREKKIWGFFTYRFYRGTLHVYRWQAKQRTPLGVSIIYKSDPFERHVFFPSPRGFPELRAEDDKIDNELYQRMLTDLARDGWEPAAWDRHWVVQMKRQIGPVDTYTGTDPVELLKQLQNLRDAGILTEQEFQTKKTEILKRI